MDKLTVEQWNELGEEDQLIRIDEKPVELSGKTGSDDPKTVEGLTEDLKNINVKLAEFEDQKSGLIGDVQAERRLRQNLEITVNELRAQLIDKGKADPFDGRDDTDTMTVGDIKKLISGLKKDSASASATNEETHLRATAVKNYSDDETRLLDKETDGKLGKVSYKDAMAEFHVLAKAKPALMIAVNAEARSGSGRPAELAYTIALTSPKFSNVIAKAAREELIQELARQGKLDITKIPGGSPTGDKTDPNLLSEQQLLDMPEAELNELLKKTG